jgi:putative hydrolase
VSDRPQPSGPFGGFDFNQMLKFLQTSGPVHWEIASQVARWVALEGAEDDGVEPAAKARLEELCAAAEAHVTEATGLPPASTGIALVGRAEWAEGNLGPMRPVLERLAESLRGGEAAAPASDEHPLGAMLGALGPLLLGVQSGFMVGRLAQQVLGQHDFLLPLDETPRPTLVVPNVDSFHGAWSLPEEDFRFFVALQEAARSRVMARPGLRRRIVELTTEYVSSYQVDPGALEARLGDLDPTDPAAVESLLSDSEAILGAMQTPAQMAVMERLRAVSAVLEAWADGVVDRLGERLLPALPQIREALRRHRTERGDADRFIGRLLGLDPSREHGERAAAFCQGVVDRAGAGALDRLLEGPELLPTPAELDAPGLWLARLELEGGNR